MLDPLEQLSEPPRRGLCDTSHFRIMCPTSMRAALENRPFLCEVLSDAPRYLREMVEKLAHYFRREFDYDFVQFDADDITDYWAYIFLEDGFSNRGKVKIATGAACFRRREWADMPSIYGLQWVWIHPFRRNRGYLKWAWNGFVKKFGDFIPEPPLSIAMVRFLEKYGTKEQKRILTGAGWLNPVTERGKDD